MRRVCAALILACGLATGAGAQQVGEVEQGTGAVLRGLDKVNASTADVAIASGASAEFGRLHIRLKECRYPAGDAAGDAYAFLTITDAMSGETLFSGWMLASSPALNPLEHPRYDIWVLRCKTE